MTPYPDVDAVLGRLLAGVRDILGPRLVGIYLDGSLALGEFEPDRSDIDFVAVTDGDLPDHSVSALAELHARLAAGESKWGAELEGSYIPARALGGRDRRPPAHPYIDRGDILRDVWPETGYWVIHRWMLRERGVVLAGPALRTLIDPVSAADLRQAVTDVVREWWAPMLTDPARLQNPFYRAYAVLTMCRVLYTLQHGTIVTKPVAAAWARDALHARWQPLIRDALAWSREAPPDPGETLALIRHTRDRSATVIP